MKAKCGEQQGVLANYIGSSAVSSVGGTQKHTFVLPSGRKLKVYVDNTSEFVETACSTPCFLLNIEDEAVG